MRVLLVDDSRGVRARLVALIGEICGVEIAGEADDADGAIALAATLAPDVVILDLQLPGKSGLDALRLLTAGSPPPEVIVLTNHATPQYRQICLERGAKWFFDKSADLDRVLEVLTAKARRP